MNEIREMDGKRTKIEIKPEDNRLSALLFSSN